MADFPSPGLQHREREVQPVKTGQPSDPHFGRGKLHDLFYRQWDLEIPLGTQAEKNTVKNLHSTKGLRPSFTVDIDSTTQTVRFVGKPKFVSVGSSHWRITAVVETYPGTS